MCQAVPGPRMAALLALALASTIALRPTVVSACGCFSPPVPAPADTNFAVNQQAELIIFEVDPGNPLLLEPATVTAHVMIQYAGDPAQFAWIVPVPTVPELELSESGVFGWLDTQTRPRVNVRQPSLCPPQQYACRVHPAPNCPNLTPPPTTPTSDPALFGSSQAGASPSDSNAPPPDVTIFKREQIGSYDTVVFGAGDAQGAVEWLNTEGFIVNDTMTPFMQPYLDAGMVFVASKLVPGADVDEIRPLRMRYLGTEPMVPLQLTAVAAEPHLTVTSFIFGAGAYEPVDHPLVEIPLEDLAVVGSRNNYPMLLSRVADEAGGDGFVREYVGAPPVYQVDDPGGCCSTDFDSCFIAQNGVCECPGSAVDEVDCSADEELTRTLDLIDRLSTEYPFLTRLTLRLSPEEMTFDPAFRVGTLSGAGPSAVLSGDVYQLANCGGDVIDQDRFAEINAAMRCATTYCGAGRCAASEDGGAGCICDEGFVARTFTDLDGLASVTCVPDQAMVDFTAGGLEVADVCTAVAALESGDCIDVGGFPSTACPVDTVAVAVAGASLPQCRPIEVELADPGTRNASVELQELDVCAPRPPGCPAATGWLEEIEVDDPGVQCETSIPDDSWFEIPPEPTCADLEGMLAVPQTMTPMSTTEERPDTEVLLTGARDRADGDGAGAGAQSSGDDDGGLCAAAPGSGAGGSTLLSLLLLCGWLAGRRRRLA